MGVYYYIASHPSTKKLIEDEDLDQIDKYIDSPTAVDGPFDEFSTINVASSNTDENAWIDGAFQIASRAVELGKKNVLRHIGGKICFDYKKDGNAYDLFVLATEKHQFEIIELLWEIATENCYFSTADEQLQYAAQRLLGYSELNEQQVIQHLPKYAEKVSSLADVYYYSKYWNKPSVQKWLEENHSSKLEYDDDGIDNVEQCTHPLRLSEFAGGPYRWGDWECDKCYQSFQKGTERWLCKLCCRDVCVECYKCKKKPIN